MQRVQTERVAIGSREVDGHHQINLHPTSYELYRSSA